jgi:hypothetical protein
MYADQDKIRCVLLDLYTDQIMDNLIRAANGLPIIQLDYTNAAATITMKQTASLQDNLATTRSTVLARAAALTTTITRQTLNTLTGNLGAERTNQVALTASPVITSNEVYDAYLAFLSLPGSLHASCDPPPHEAVHLCRKWHEQYYWVPVEYKREFLGLSLATTAQRGKALLAPEEFFQVTLQEVISQEPPSKFGEIDLLVKFDKKIPNDSGRVELTFDGKTVTFLVGEYLPTDAARPAETDRLRLGFDPQAESAKKADLKTVAQLKFPMPAKFYLRHNRPKPPTTNDLLDRINFQLQQIQFNQLRTATSGP